MEPQDRNKTRGDDNDDHGGDMSSSAPPSCSLTHRLPDSGRSRLTHIPARQPVCHLPLLPQSNRHHSRHWRPRPRRDGLGQRRRLRRQDMPPVLLIGLLFCVASTASGLICFTCVQSPGTTQLDNFRVSTRLSAPICPMEPIRCDRDQDVCVRISMHIGGGEYWMGAGCDRRINFQHLACQNVRTVSRSVQLGYVQERHAMQRVCVCTRDMCNLANGGYNFILSLTLVGLYLLLR